MPWWVNITACGNTGHGSRFIEGTAIEQIINISQKALLYRENQKKLLHSDVDTPNTITTSNINTSLLTSTTTTNTVTNNNNDNNNSSIRYKHENCSHSIAYKKRRTLGDVTTLNITQLHAGIVPMRTLCVYVYMSCMPVY